MLFGKASKIILSNCAMNAIEMMFYPNKIG